MYMDTGMTEFEHEFADINIDASDSQHDYEIVTFFI